MICIFCSTNKKPQSQSAGEGVHAKESKLNKKYVKMLKEKLKSMPLILKDSKVNGQLFSGNIASNELYYHSLWCKSCFKD